MRYQHTPAQAVPSTAAPVDPARAAAIEALVQDLRKRAYLPLIRKPDQTLELVPSALNDDALVAADRFDREAPIQAAFEMARQAMLTDFELFFGRCRASPFEDRGGVSELQTSRLKPGLRQAVEAARGDADLTAVEQAGADLWRHRDELARQDKEEKQQRAAEKRKQRDELYKLLVGIQAEVFFEKLPGAWTSDEFAAAEPFLADLIPSLELEKLWMERAEDRFAVYGSDQRAQNAVTELAKTPMGQTILERLTAAVAEARPDCAMGSPSLVVERTRTKSVNDPDWRLMRAKRDARDGR